MTLLNSHSDLAFSTIASAPLMLLMRLKIKFNCHLVLIRWENWRTGENLQRKRINKLNPHFVGGSPTGRQLYNFGEGRFLHHCCITILPSPCLLKAWVFSPLSITRGRKFEFEISFQI